MTITAESAVDQTSKIWVNSGDSHFLEPEDLWATNLPAALAERMPRTVKDEEAGTETVHIDGQQFVRKLPNPALTEFREASSRPPGARAVVPRLADLDQEGIWGEVVFPSLGMWNNSFRDPALLKAAVEVANDWALAEIQDASPRLVIAAQVSMLDIDDAIAELHRVAAKGAVAVFMPTTPPPPRTTTTATAGSRSGPRRRRPGSCSRSTSARIPSTCPPRPSASPIADLAGRS